MAWPFALPWLRSESRAAGDYTDRLTAALLEAAVNPQLAHVTATGALEAAAGIVSRCFALAALDPPSPRLRSVTPAMRAAIGRALIERGQFVALIDVARDGRLTLEAATRWRVTGGAPPWRYQLTLPRPNGRRTLQRPAAAVLDIRVNADPDQPWRGRGALEVAASSGGLMAHIEARLHGEAKGVSGYVIPSPTAGDADDGDDDDTSPTGQLRADVRKLGGRSMLVPSMAAAWGEGAANSPRMGDWRPERIGINPPAEVVELRRDVEASVLGAAGVPVELIRASDSGAAREAWRRFALGTLEPLGDLAGAALAESLDLAAVRFDWHRLAAADIASRARAYGSMVTGGMDEADARRLAGLAS